ncbi:MAG: acyltransferase [Muribaculaceae bacterium]|nr:acyltransferase [Muribaculaceae bacterium]
MSTTQKQRLPYIDFMKGLCILLIVQQHIDIDHNFYPSIHPQLNPALQSFRIPMYYFLSGIFFKTYNGFSDFLRRKVNNMIIPLLFFEVLALLVAWPVAMYKQSHGIDSTVGFSWMYIFDPFTIRAWHYTYPMWFLLSLFEVNVMFYLIQKYLSSVWRVVAVVFLAAMGYACAYWHVQLPLHFDTALVGIPYFMLGWYVKQKDVLVPSKYDKWGLYIFIPVMIVIFFVSAGIGINQQELPNWLQLYIVPFIAILTLFWACKNLPKIPVITYFGRYSIIILGTHVVFCVQMRSVAQAFGIHDSQWVSFVAFLITMAVEAIIIAVLIRVFPRYTAQKEFFKEGWKPYFLN